MSRQQQITDDCADDDPTFIADLPANESSIDTDGTVNDVGRSQTHVVRIPRLAFGLYKIPNDEKGERTVIHAIQAGYRHFDSASVYGNEVAVGRALHQCRCSSSSNIPPIVQRSDLYIASKVWNDAQMQGREAVRRSVLKSIQDLQLDYLDICYVHWPVPGRYIETYKELQQLVKEKKISAIGISNFTIEEYETLMADPDISIRPQIHQFEVSPFMYRPQYIQYFQNRGIMVAASKALNRASGIITANDREAQDDGIGSIVDRIAVTHNVSSAQIMLRWSFQKDLIVLAKTSNPHRMKENRGIISFELSLDEMKMLDGITTEGDIDARAKLEEERKRGS